MSYVWWKKPLYIFFASLKLSRPKVQESEIAPDKDGRNLKLADNPDTGLLRGSGWGLTD